MRFPHPVLELAYRDHLATSQRVLTTVSLLVAALLFAVAEPLARTLVPSEIAALDTAVRWYLNLPLALLALAYRSYYALGTTEMDAMRVAEPVEE